MRTLLAVDMGNTRVKVGLYVDATLVARLHVDTDLVWEVAGFSEQLCETFGNWKSIDVCWVASVVRGLFEPASKAILDVWGVQANPVTAQHDLGIQVGVPKPEGVGIDRLLEASEAFRLMQSGVVVATLGSAMTVDWVDDAGVFQGGTILPGLHTSLRALHLETSLLPEVEVRLPDSVLGKDTVACMQAGIVYGAAGAVDRIYQELVQVAGKALPMLVTGGDAKIIAPFLHTSHEIQEDLVLRGLVTLDGRYPKKTPDSV